MCRVAFLLLGVCCATAKGPCRFSLRRPFCSLSCKLGRGHCHGAMHHPPSHETPPAEWRMVRLFDDGDESHWGTSSYPFTSGGDIGRMTDPLPCESVRLRWTSGSYDYKWHNAPRRQLIATLNGHVEASVGSGEKRRFGPGDVLLAEVNFVSSAPHHTAPHHATPPTHTPPPCCLNASGYARARALHKVIGRRRALEHLHRVARRQALGVALGAAHPKRARSACPPTARVGRAPGRASSQSPRSLRVCQPGLGPRDFRSSRSASRTRHLRSTGP